MAENVLSGSRDNVLSEIRGLVVSCQAEPGTPLDHPQTLARIARCVCEGGATAIRAAQTANVAAIKTAVDVPVLGLVKRDHPGCEVRITPTFQDAVALALVGADAIAVDATDRSRPDGITTDELIGRIRNELKLPVLADVDTLRSAQAAQDAGADAIATTLSGYTRTTCYNTEGPDIELVRELAARLSVPVVAEGRYTTREQVGAAFEAGARAVVVGTAITSPNWLTAQLITANPSR